VWLKHTLSDRAATAPHRGVAGENVFQASVCSQCVIIQYREVVLCLHKWKVYCEPRELGEQLIYNNYVAGVYE